MDNVSQTMVDQAARLTEHAAGLTASIDVHRELLEAQVFALLALVHVIDRLREELTK